MRYSAKVADLGIYLYKKIEILILNVKIDKFTSPNM